MAIPPGRYRPRDLLASHGLARSRSDAERLLRQGAVRKDGALLETGAEIIVEAGSFVISVGPSRFLRFVVHVAPRLDTLPGGE